MNNNFKWTYKNVIKNLEALKSQYRETIASFSWTQGKERNEYIKTIKRKVYSLKVIEWKQDQIWEYFNNDGGLPKKAKQNAK